MEFSNKDELYKYWGEAPRPRLPLFLTNGRLQGNTDLPPFCDQQNVAVTIDTC